MCGSIMRVDDLPDGRILQRQFVLKTFLTCVDNHKVMQFRKLSCDMTLYILLQILSKQRLPIEVSFVIFPLMCSGLVISSTRSYRLGAKCRTSNCPGSSSENRTSQILCKHHGWSQLHGQYISLSSWRQSGDFGLRWPRVPAPIYRSSSSNYPAMMTVFSVFRRRVRRWLFYDFLCTSRRGTQKNN